MKKKQASLRSPTDCRTKSDSFSEQSSSHGAFAITNTIKNHRLDIIVLAFLLLVTVSLLLVVTFTKAEGNYVVVEIDGTISGEYPLFINGTFELNGGTNTLVIENGEAYLSYSNCPDHTCEKTGKIRYVGETIICLPNRLSITVQGEYTENSVDLIS